MNEKVLDATVKLIVRTTNKITTDPTLKAYNVDKVSNFTSEMTELVLLKLREKLRG